MLQRSRRIDSERFQAQYTGFDHYEQLHVGFIEVSIAFLGLYPWWSIEPLSFQIWRTSRGRKGILPQCQRLVRSFPESAAIEDHVPLDHDSTDRFEYRDWVLV